MGVCIIPTQEGYLQRPPTKDGLMYIQSIASRTPSNAIVTNRPSPQKESEPCTSSVTTLYLRTPNRTPFFTTQPYASAPPQRRYFEQEVSESFFAEVSRIRTQFSPLDQSQSRHFSRPNFDSSPLALPVSAQSSILRARGIQAPEAPTLSD